MAQSATLRASVLAPHEELPKGFHRLRRPEGGFPQSVACGVFPTEASGGANANTSRLGRETLL
ncbi:MAG: hypothetical protein KME46_11470 [Brasilonema angustatum HA4187-MV1]|nr:hypothetical protein [Brasilonema angustatum HA4187-MV1]